eukprot:TRINITY_DN30718_c0_g1_i1.p1 TRINITY_DN30718_c0_g1~~TRINITY_DN30718_c0_g1_i1.p1  ORF type:complete len:220 (+),score=62.40 TRINITY_DN30718_c0_g1_i1:180-839(+)
MSKTVDLVDSDDELTVVEPSAGSNGKTKTGTANDEKKDAVAAKANATGAESSAPAEPEVPIELPKGRWDCPSCGENNREDRLKCHNCHKARPGTEKLTASQAASAMAAMAAKSASSTETKATAEGSATGGDRKRRRRGGGWDDWEEQAKKAASAASAANATMMKDVINSWKPTVEQLKAMTVAELTPICKSWKIHIDPKNFMRDVMLAKALKVIHGIEG